MAQELERTQDINQSLVRIQIERVSCNPEPANGNGNSSSKEAKSTTNRSVAYEQPTGGERFYVGKGLIKVDTTSRREYDEDDQRLRIDVLEPGRGQVFVAKHRKVEDVGTSRNVSEYELIGLSAGNVVLKVDNQQISSDIELLLRHAFIKDPDIGIARVVDIYYRQNGQVHEDRT